MASDASRTEDLDVVHRYSFLLLAAATITATGCLDPGPTHGDASGSEDPWAALEATPKPDFYSCQQMYVPCGLQGCPWDSCELANASLHGTGDVGAAGVYQIEEVALPAELPGNVRYQLSLQDGWTASTPASATMSLRIERPGCGLDFLRTFAKSVDVGSTIIVISVPPWENSLGPLDLATGQGLFYRKPSGGYTNGHIFVQDDVDLATLAKLFSTTFTEIQSGHTCSSVVAPDEQE